MHIWWTILQILSHENERIAYQECAKSLTDTVSLQLKLYNGNMTTITYLVGGNYMTSKKPISVSSFTLMCPESYDTKLKHKTTHLNVYFPKYSRGWIHKRLLSNDVNEISSDPLYLRMWHHTQDTCLVSRSKMNTGNFKYACVWCIRCNIRRTIYQNLNDSRLGCSCLCPIHWNHVLSWEKRYSNYIWVNHNFIAH